MIAGKDFMEESKGCFQYGLNPGRGQRFPRKRRSDQIAPEDFLGASRSGDKFNNVLDHAFGGIVDPDLPCPRLSIRVFKGGEL